MSCVDNENNTTLKSENNTEFNTENYLPVGSLIAFAGVIGGRLDLPGDGSGGFTAMYLL